MFYGHFQILLFPSICVHHLFLHLKTVTYLRYFMNAVESDEFEIPEEEVFLRGSSKQH